MVGLVDCDNFFCSCERVFRPDLAHTPLVVLSNNDGCVVARSREAKAMGVTDCMPYFRLTREFAGRGIVAFSSNYTLYADLSARVMAVLRQEVPAVTQYSIDEAFLDLDGMSHLQLKQWGEQLCAKVQRFTGMPVSMGIAPSATLAKMASRFAKRYPGYNKCCMIATESQRIKALELTDVADVWGIGHRITAALRACGIHSALAFSLMQRHWVRRRFHVTGERTWEELNGHSVIEPESIEGTTKKSIVTGRSFPDMLTDPADISSHVANNAARCAMKLRRQGSVCATLTVSLQTNRFRPDLPQHCPQASHTFITATSSTQELVQAAMALFHAIHRPGIAYKRAAVMVSGLSSADSVQYSLFDHCTPAARRKLNDASQAIDAINRRLGADTVVLGAQQYRQRDPDGRSVRYVNAIRRAMKSPDYTTRLGAFAIP